MDRRGSSKEIPNKAPWSCFGAAGGHRMVKNAPQPGDVYLEFSVRDAYIEIPSIADGVPAACEISRPRRSFGEIWPLP